MKGTTIEINSLEALERLLGGNTEFEIEVRQSTAAAFANKHIKGILTEPQIKAIKESLFTPHYYNQTLREEILSVVKPHIREVAVKIIKEEIQAIVVDIMDAEGSKKKLEATVSAISEYFSKAWVDNVVEKNIIDRATILINEKLKS